METLPQIENQEHFPYEIKTKFHERKEEITEYINSGKPVNFLVTKNLDIWLTMSTHNSLTAHGVTSEDVDTMGYIKITDNKPEIKFYGDRPKKSPQIRESIFNFLDLI